jgi:hypothetical protein
MDTSEKADLIDLAGRLHGALVRLFTEEDDDSVAAELFGRHHREENIVALVGVLHGGLRSAWSKSRGHEDVILYGLKSRVEHMRNLLAHGGVIASRWIVDAQEVMDQLAILG